MKNIAKIAFLGLGALVLVFGISAPLASAATPPTVVALAASNIQQTQVDLNGTVNPEGSTTSAWFEFNSTNYGTQNGLTGSSAIPMTYTLTGLTAGTTYTFRVSAINAGGPVQSNIVSFTTAPAQATPTVVTLAASNITTTSADLNGTVNPNGATTSSWFEFNSTNYGTQNGLSGNAAIPMTYNLTGLTPNTTYTYRVSAVNSGGPINGNVITFTTLPNPTPAAPTVVATAATAVTTTTATLNGSVNPNNLTTSSWFEFNSTNYGTLNGLSGNAAIPMSFNLVGLTPNTTYTFRVSAVNSAGPVNSNVITFTTLGLGGGPAPIITTGAASSVTTTSATLNGTWDAQGFSTTTWFEYGPTMALGSTTAPVVQGLGSGVMSSAIAGLSSGTTYFYRAVGQNTNGTANGSILSFATSGASGGGGSGGGGSYYFASAITNSASNIFDVSTTLNGYIDPNGSQTNYWFEYGTNSGSLNNVTPTVLLGYSPANVSANISNLLPNTSYYFRAAAQNNYGVVYGTVLGFTTASNGSVSTIGPVVVTAPTSAIGKTSAKLNAILTDSKNQPTSVWFEYGTSVDLGSATASQSISNSGASFSETLTGLNPNTIYFARAVAQNGLGTNKGTILVFKTLPKSSEIVVNTGNGGNGNTNSKNEVSFKLETENQNARVGDSINLTLKYKNLGSKPINNAVIRATLPAEIEFKNSTAGSYSEGSRELTANLGTIEAGTEGSIEIAGKISSSASNKDVLVMTADFIYTNEGSRVQEDVVSYALINVNHDNSLAAASIFGTGFMPKTAIGWIVLILILAGLVLMGRKFYAEVNWTTVAGKLKDTFKKN